MDVKELIESERKWLQDQLDKFLEIGCFMAVYPLIDGRHESREPLFRTTISGMKALRVAPHFDAAGNHTGSTFWVFWNGLGYDEGFQFTHTNIVTRIETPDTYILDLWGGEYHLHLEWLMPDVTSDEAARFADLQTWRAYQAANADRFARLDAQLLEEHTGIANQWPSD
jgi:hypothetical protein